MPMRVVPQAAFLKGDPMTRQALIVIGVVFLFVGCAGLTVGIVWLVAGRVLGTLPYILDARFETVLYLLPALLLMVAITGASFMATALTARQKRSRKLRHLRFHPRFHA
jgi:hypothetical protein